MKAEELRAFAGLINRLRAILRKASLKSPTINLSNKPIKSPDHYTQFTDRAALLRFQEEHRVAQDSQS